MSLKSASECSAECLGLCTTALVAGCGTCLSGVGHTPWHVVGWCGLAGFCQTMCCPLQAHQENQRRRQVRLFKFRRVYSQICTGSCAGVRCPGPRPRYIRGVVSCRVVSCRVVSCRVVSCRVVSCRVVSCRVVLCCVVLCCVVLCCVVLCCVVLCCVVLCCVARQLNSNRRETKNHMGGVDFQLE